jgi:hypothetical protein
MIRLAFVWLEAALSASVTLAGGVVDALSRQAVRRAP